MKWKLWLDDLRNPAVECPTETGFVWARDTEQAKYYTEMWGPPSSMALDHDLGIPVGATEAEDVFVYLRWLSSNFPRSCPEYRVHSANPVGQKNIVAFMESWKKSRPWFVKHGALAGSLTFCEQSRAEIIQKEESIAEKAVDINCPKCRAAMEDFHS